MKIQSFEFPAISQIKNHVLSEKLFLKAIIGSNCIMYIVYKQCYSVLYACGLVLIYKLRTIYLLGVKMENEWKAMSAQGKSCLST